MLGGPTLAPRAARLRLPIALVPQTARSHATQVADAVRVSRGSQHNHSAPWCARARARRFPHLPVLEAPLDVQPHLALAHKLTPADRARAGAAHGARRGGKVREEPWRLAARSLIVRRAARGRGRRLRHASLVVRR